MDEVKLKTKCEYCGENLGAIGIVRWIDHWNECKDYPRNIVPLRNYITKEEWDEFKDSLSGKNNG